MEPTDLESTENRQTAEVQNPRPSPARSEAARKNGEKSLGHPRVPMDWREFERLRRKGLSVAAIARQVGISRWTLKRRIAERLRMDDPM